MAFWSKRSEPKDEIVDRYDGKPLLRFVDAYVLDAMGILDEETRRQMEEIGPKLSASLGTTAKDWKHIVEELMHFPDDLANQIHSLWTDTQAKANAEGQEIDPIRFAHQIADYQIG